VVAATPAVDPAIWQWLTEVPDLEIPVVSVIDLGMVREVAYDGGTLVVTITPT
jgi:ring-1,2-phenylacetyl-CoA epoxidase subunit PaaD